MRTGISYPSPSPPQRRRGHIGTLGYTMQRLSIVSPCSRGGKGKRTRLNKRWREVGNLSCASSFLKRLLSIVASLTSLCSFSCLVSLPAKSNLQAINGLATEPFMDDLPCVLSALQYLHTKPPSIAHVVDWKARCSASIISPHRTRGVSGNVPGLCRWSRGVITCDFS